MIILLIIILFFIVFFLLNYNLETFFAKKKKKSKSDLVHQSKGKIDINNHVLNEVIKEKWVQEAVNNTNELLEQHKLKSKDGKEGYDPKISKRELPKMKENLKIWFMQPKSKKDKHKLRFQEADSTVYHDAKMVWDNMLRESRAYLQTFRAFEKKSFLPAYNQVIPDFENKIKEGDEYATKILRESVKQLADYYIKGRKSNPNQILKQRDQKSMTKLHEILKKEQKEFHDKHHVNSPDTKNIGKGDWKKPCQNEKIDECLKNKIMSFAKTAKAGKDKLDKLEEIQGFLDELKEDPIIKKLGISSPSDTGSLVNKLKPVVDWANKQDGVLQNVAENILGPVAMEFGAGIGELFGGPIGGFITKKTLQAGKKGARYLYNLYKIKKKVKNSGVSNINDFLDKIFKGVENNPKTLDKAIKLVKLVVENPPTLFSDFLKGPSDSKLENNWEIFTKLVKSSKGQMVHHEKDLKGVIKAMKEKTFDHVSATDLKLLPRKGNEIIYTYIFNVYPDLKHFLPVGYPTDYKSCILKYEQSQKGKEKFTNYDNVIRFVPVNFYD